MAASFVIIDVDGHCRRPGCSSRDQLRVTTSSGIFFCSRSAFSSSSAFYVQVSCSAVECFSKKMQLEGNLRFEVFIFSINPFLCA